MEYTKARIKAIELVEQFKDNVNPYIGSGMLTNIYDDDAILWQSKICATKTVNEIIKVVKEIEPNLKDWKHEYWQNVKEQIDKITLSI